jgi:hypothetical protein
MSKDGHHEVSQKMVLLFKTGHSEQFGMTKCKAISSH